MAALALRLPGITVCAVANAVVPVLARRLPCEILQSVVVRIVIVVTGVHPAWARANKGLQHEMVDETAAVNLPSPHHPRELDIPPATIVLRLFEDFARDVIGHGSTLLNFRTGTWNRAHSTQIRHLIEVFHP